MGRGIREIIKSAVGDVDGRPVKWLTSGYCHFCMGVRLLGSQVNRGFIILFGHPGKQDLILFKEAAC